MAASITFLMNAKEAAHRLGRHQIAGDGIKASCPVPGHGLGRGDLNPSLTLTDGDDGRLLFHCKGNCSQEEVLDALIEKGIATRDEHNGHFHRAPMRAKPLPNAHSKKTKTEKPADDWEPVPLDTEGAPDEAPEQILLRSGTLERGPGGFLLVTRDADRKVTGKVDVTAIKKFTIRQRDGRPVVVDVRIEFGWQDDKGRPNKEIRPVSLWRNRNTGKLEWKSRQWPRGKMQVYGQENVMPGDVVTIHEGPLKTDIATEILPQIKHVSFCGGSGMAGHHVWSFLKDCRVVGFADNDKPGKDAMKRIGELAIEAGARSFGIVEWASGTPAGHGIDDLAGQEAGADDAEVMIEDAINRSVPKTETKQAFTKDEADLATLTGFELHEDGVAQAFTANFKDFLKFCHTHGAWFHWTGTHWKLEQTSLAFAWAREICRQLGRDVKSKTKFQLAKASTASAVERFARSDRAHAVTSEVWDRDPWLLGTPDGVVDLRTGQLRASQPGDYITKVTAVGPAPPGTRAPTWERFLEDATRGDKELQRFLQQMTGYALSGDVSEECLFFVHGPGGNGKGVFLRTIGAILGDYATSAAMDTFTSSKTDKHPTDLAKLAGARMVTASETEEGRSWAEARIKEITGNERPISARFMRQDFFEYMPQFKLIIVGNHRPILNNVDDAIRRRFNIVPFTNKPTNVDHQLKDKLEAEFPAILRWMIDGCLDWQKNRLVRPTSVLEATKEYFDSQDVFGQWVREHCQIDPGNKDLWEKSADLYESWVRYCSGHGEESGKERDLGTKLTKVEVGKGTKRLFGTVTAIRTGIRLIRNQEHDDGFHGSEGGL